MGETTVDRWKERVVPEKARVAPSEAGGELDLSYFPRPRDAAEFDAKIGAPGEYPFTRGVYPAMYRDRMWQMRLYSGFGTAEETNERWRFLLAHGNMGVSAAFDLPTQCGLDSDHPEARAEVGRVGVAADTLADFEVMFDGLPIDKMGISLNAHSTAPFVLAMFLAFAERQGVAPGQLRGSMTTDVLKDYVARGTWVFPPRAGMRLVGDILEYCSEEMPKFYPLVIRGPDMRDAGATMAQEVGFAFANLVAYLSYASERGLDVDSFAPRLSAQFYFYGHFLQEAAKARAARRIWAQLLKERFGAKNPASLLMRITASVGGTHFQAFEPETNIVRGTLGCLGAVLGGSQGMLLAGYDEAYDIPTEHTARLALRTQQIVGYESDATDVADPLGGSWFVEQLTDDIEAVVRETMATIEDQGGAVQAIESGYMQRAIAESALDQERREQSGELPLVGVNMFAENPEAEELVVHETDAAVADRQVARLEAVRARRDDGAVQRSLEELDKAAHTDANLMPLLLDCARAEASIGEMVDTLKKTFGEFVEPGL
jgi:methylmalonyl-CoA mutase N-terminal domain/subunit